MNFLTKHSKAFYMAYGILIGAAIILGVFYTSQYADIRVLYAYTATGELSILASTQDKINNSNQFLFQYFQNGASNGLQAATGFSTDFSQYAMTVYNFQVLISSVNDLIIVFGVISLVAFAFLLVLSNHNRRIYYKSNLIGGIILPLVVVVLFIILIIRNFQVMSAFEENSTLFNVVSLLQGKTQSTLSQYNYSKLSELFSCNSTSFILYTVLFVVVIVYSCFMSLYALLKYKATAEERAEIEKKAVANND